MESKTKIKITKASDLQKVSLTKEMIYEIIGEANMTSRYKHAIPNDTYISTEVIASIINDGFKVYKGDIFTFKDAYIIEW